MHGRVAPTFATPVPHLQVCGAVQHGQPQASSHIAGWEVRVPVSHCAEGVPLRVKHGRRGLAHAFHEVVGPRHGHPIHGIHVQGRELREFLVGVHRPLRKRCRAAKIKVPRVATGDVHGSGQPNPVNAVTVVKTEGRIKVHDLGTSPVLDESTTKIFETPLSP